ncbi:MAG: bifunctional sugar-1-phosphate nucleotidylyltransferase/acetyltransferase [Candidatus Helarchaeota archaeon]
MKTLILAAGEGKRLRPLTETMPKPMLLIAGKPTLQHVIENLKKTGLNDFIIVVGFLKEQIMDYFGTGFDFGVKIKYIEQPKPEGPEDAVLVARSELENESEFLIAHADIFTDPEMIKRTIETYEKLKPEATISVTLVDNPSLYGMVAIDEEARIQRIVEKPKEGESPSNFAVAGIYIFKSDIFEHLEKTKHFDSAIQSIITENGNTYSSVWEKEWVEIRYPWDILRANEFVLKRELEGKGSFISESADISDVARITGPVYISENATVKAGAEIVGPCFIDKGVYVGTNSLVRQYSSIGRNARLGFGTEIKNSVIFPETKVGRLCFIGDSIIGKNVGLSSSVQVSNFPSVKEVGLDVPKIIMNFKNESIVVPLEKFGAIIGNGALLGNNVSINPGRKIGRKSIILPGCVIETDVPSDTMVSVKQSLEYKKLK